MKDLRFFETETDYNNTFFEYPNVSYVAENSNVYIKENEINRTFIATYKNNVGYKTEILCNYYSDDGCSAYDYRYNLSNVESIYIDDVKQNEIKRLYNLGEKEYVTVKIVLKKDNLDKWGTYNMFRYCTNLTSIIIPSDITSFEWNTFVGCTNLSEITCLATVPPTIEYDTFSAICSNGVLKVPSGSDYSSWMSTSSYYLGYYNWTIEYI